MVNLNKSLTKRLSKEQLDVLVRSIEEKNEIPIRVVYTQEYWDKIAMDNDYKLANRELSALKSIIKKLAIQFNGKKINIIHLGVGNGVEIPIIIDAFSEKNIVNYSIVDVNPATLAITEKRIAEKFPNQKVRKFLQDIETYGINNICEETKEDGAEINIIFLIANGVLFSNDKLVTEIYRSLNEGDYFFLTLELYQNGKDKEIIKSYLIPSVLDLLANGIKLIGYDPNYKEFTAEINKDENLLKVYYSPTADRSKKFLVLHSYKPTLEKLNKRMESLNFKNIFIEEYQEIHTCAALYNK